MKKGWMQFAAAAVIWPWTVSIVLSNDPTEAADSIEFGTNVGLFAGDGECDDPRFRGPGMATFLNPDAIFHDASDCKSAFSKRRIWLSTGFGDLDFGDDDGSSSSDGFCDDPRFEGPGMATRVDSDNQGRDRTDCWMAFLAHRLVPKVSTRMYGDDSSPHAKDGECDDPRFRGIGMAHTLGRRDLGRDAFDCARAVQEGTVEWIEVPADGTYKFGDNSSRYAYDGECDDPRFRGEGIAETLDRKDVGKDAVDCFRAWKDGTVDWIQVPVSARVEFGYSSSRYAYDGECDDPRFHGQGMAGILNRESVGKDAFDCSRLFGVGLVSLDPDYTWTPLLDAVISRDAEKVRFVLMSVDNPDEPSEEGLTPLMWVAETGGEPEVMRLLIGKDAGLTKIDSIGRTPLHFAMSSDPEAEVIELLANESVVRMSDSSGRTPLHVFASVTDNPENISLLVDDYRADPNAADNSGQTPLHYVSEVNDNADVVTALVESGADWRKRDENGETPLFRAVALGNIQALEELLSCGADPDSTNNGGESARERAVRERNPLVSKVLSEHPKGKVSGAKSCF